MRRRHDGSLRCANEHETVGGRQRSVPLLTMIASPTWTNLWSAAEWGEEERPEGGQLGMGFSKRSCPAYNVLARWMLPRIAGATLTTHTLRTQPHPGMSATIPDS